MLWKSRVHSTLKTRCSVEKFVTKILHTFQSVNPPHGQWPDPMGSWRVSRFLLTFCNCSRYHEYDRKYDRKMVSFQPSTFYLYLCVWITEPVPPIRIHYNKAVTHFTTFNTTLHFITENSAIAYRQKSITFPDLHNNTTSG